MQHEAELKKVRNITLLLGVVYIAAGLAMIAAQDRFRVVLGIGIGFVAVIYGLYRVILYIRHRTEKLIATDLYIGAILVFFGVLGLVHFRQLVDYTALIFAVLLFAGALVKVQNAIDLRALGYEKWWVALILGLVSAVVAELLINPPSFVADIYMTCAGVFLIYDGLSGFASFIYAHTVFGRIRKGLEPNKPKMTEKPEQPEVTETGGPQAEAPVVDAAYEPCNDQPAAPESPAPDEAAEAGTEEEQ